MTKGCKCDSCGQFMPVDNPPGLAKLEWRKYGDSALDGSRVREKQVDLCASCSERLYCEAIAADDWPPDDEYEYESESPISKARKRHDG